MAGHAPSTRNEAPPAGAGRPLPIVLDVGDLGHPDLGAIEALCLFALEVHRCEARVRLEGASVELLELIDLAGLDRVLPSGRRRWPAANRRSARSGQLPGVSQTG